MLTSRVHFAVRDVPSEDFHGFEVVDWAKNLLTWDRLLLCVVMLAPIG